MNPHKMLVLILRLLAFATIFAIVFVFCPWSWIEKIHEAIGMGRLEHTALLSYLARTLSAMYTIVGLFVFIASCEIARFMPIIKALAWVAIIGGILVTYFDYIIKLPIFWTILEGPFTIIFGLIVLYLSKKIKMISE